MKKRLLSILLTLCILLCAMPSYVFSVSAATESDTVTFTALDGNGSNTDSENYEKLVDNDKSTKWYSSPCNVYIVIRASRSVAVNGYTFTTGNDTGDITDKNRNPKNWTLYGCNDYDESEKTGSWTALHTVNNDTTMEQKNTTDYDFSFENSAEYLYYKLEITSSGSGQMQLSEMKFHLVENDWYTSAEGQKLTLGTNEILDPASGSWQHLYFGKWEGEPIDFRILSKSTKGFGNGKTTMFLENAEYLFEKNLSIPLITSSGHIVP